MWSLHHSEESKNAAKITCFNRRSRNWARKGRLRGHATINETTRNRYITIEKCGLETMSSRAYSAVSRKVRLKNTISLQKRSRKTKHEPNRNYEDRAPLSLLPLAYWNMKDTSLLTIVPITQSIRARTRLFTSYKQWRLMKTRGSPTDDYTKRRTTSSKGAWHKKPKQWCFSRDHWKSKIMLWTEWHHQSKKKIKRKTTW